MNDQDQFPGRCFTLESCTVLLDGTKSDEPAFICNICAQVYLFAKHHYLERTALVPLPSRDERWRPDCTPQAATPSFNGCRMCGTTTWKPYDKL